MEETPMFRASKKRKVARAKRAATEEEEKEVQDITAKDVATDVASEATGLPTTESQTSNLAELIKLRNKKSRPGVSFNNLTTSSRDRDDGSRNSALVAVSTSEDILKDIPSRFTSSVGHVVDIDQHMMAYIDSAMAGRNAASGLQKAQLKGPAEHDSRSSTDDDYTDASENDDNDDINDASRDAQQIKQGTGGFRAMTSTTGTKSTIPVHNQPHSLTEVSIETLPTSTTTTKQTARPRRPRKPRLGRDGKPFRPRPRKRANSTDQARDRLVEQILSEHRGTTATGPAVPTTATASSSTGNPSDPKSTTMQTPQVATGMNVEADEQLAAEFRRQFFENAAERRLRAANHHRQNNAANNSSLSSSTKKKGGAGSGGGGQTDTAFLSGPKLGGSRSARAKMYAARMAEKEKEKEAAAASAANASGVSGGVGGSLGAAGK